MGRPRTIRSVDREPAHVLAAVHGVPLALEFSDVFVRLVPALAAHGTVAGALAEGVQRRVAGVEEEKLFPEAAEPTVRPPFGPAYVLPPVVRRLDARQRVAHRHEGDPFVVLQALDELGYVIGTASQATSARGRPVLCDGRRGRIVPWPVELS